MYTNVILYFPLLALPILALLYYSGPLSAAGLTVFSTLIGTVGLIFSVGVIFSVSGIAEKLVPLVIFFQIAWFWTLFWLAEKQIEMRDLEKHRMQEEGEKLELSGLDFQQQKKEMEEFCEDIQDRIFRYSELRNFTDKLAESLKLKEVRDKATQLVQSLFTGEDHVKTQIKLFPYPNSPEKGDSLAEWMTRHRIPLLITDTSQDMRFPSNGFKKGVSILSCPLERENYVVGTLTLESDQPRKWKEEDLRFFSDISSIISLSIANAVYFEKVETLAVKDSLTGLFVRYRFDERVEQEFHRAKASGSPLSLILFDIDHFKKVNDEWGHPAGDIVLQMVSQIILGGTRETDFCARYGGEEIAVIMPFTGIENAWQIGERIRKKIETTSYGGEKIRVTISGGVTTADSSMETSQDFIQSVDQALYKAKEEGRNRLVKASL